MVVITSFTESSCESMLFSASVWQQRSWRSGACAARLGSLVCIGKKKTKSSFTGALRRHICKMFVTQQMQITLVFLSYVSFSSSAAVENVPILINHFRLLAQRSSGSQRCLEKGRHE